MTLTEKTGGKRIALTIIVISDHIRAAEASTRLDSVAVDQMDVFTDNKTLLDSYPHML